MGGGTTKTVQENKPPAWSKPLFEQSASEAQKIYDSGAGGGVYQGQTVAGLGNTTQSGIAGVQGAANAYNDPAYQSALKGPTSSSQNLQGMASGEYLKSGNPYFEDALRGQLEKTAAQTQSQFSGSGRYGSGANTDVLTNQLGNIRSTALSDQFNRDSQNMLAANGQIDTSNQNQLGLQGNALAGNLAAQQGVIGAGQLQDQNKQAGLQADYAKWMAEDMQDWTRLGLLQSAAAGSAGNYGTNVQTQNQPFNPMSAIGGIGSMFAKSDARLKENVTPITVRNGHTIWQWNYKGDDARFEGVMAQEVLERDPEAVVVDYDGFYAVDYAKIGLEMVRVH